MSDLRATLARQVLPQASRYVGVATAAVRGEETAFLSAGVARAGGDRRVDERTVLEIGSVTKVFTALLLADQALAGRVTLDEPVQELFPDLRLPVRGRPMTLADLATHTSGLPRLPPGLLPQALRRRDDPYAGFTADDLAAALERVRPRRQPGRRVRYSNFGAAVLGEALARRAGSSYAALLAERVTGPLGLADTVVEPRPDQRDRRASGHGGRRRPVPDWSMPALPGMGALHSTAADLAAFVEAQLDPDRTPLAEAIRLTHRPRAGRGPLRVGLGWMLLEAGRGGPVSHWHNGGTGGARSFVGFVADRGVGAVGLTNCRRSTDRLGFDLLRALADS